MWWKKRKEWNPLWKESAILDKDRRVESDETAILYIDTILVLYPSGRVTVERRALLTSWHLALAKSTYSIDWLDVDIVSYSQWKMYVTLPKFWNSE